MGTFVLDAERGHILYETVICPERKEKEAKGKVK